jgi:hypothetical protein
MDKQSEQAKSTDHLSDRGKDPAVQAAHGTDDAMLLLAQRSAATPMQHADLPGVDAALLEPLRSLPRPVTLKEAQGAFAPTPHCADPRATKL